MFKIFFLQTYNATICDVTKQTLSDSVIQNCQYSDLWKKTWAHGEFKVLNRDVR